MSTAHEQPILALTGTLDAFRPIHVLRMLQMARATGRLHVEHGEERADLFLIEGHSAFAFTNFVHLRVGDVLVHGGEIRPEAMELVAAVQQDVPGSRIGRMLVENGTISPERLREAVLEVQRSIICRVLLWESGKFRFHGGERAADEDITLDLDLDDLVLDALRVASRSGEGRLAA